jgi:hypothetical protein
MATATLPLNFWTGDGARRLGRISHDAPQAWN